MQKISSGVFGLVDPSTGKIGFVTSSEDIHHAFKKYVGDLKRMVGTPKAYAWLSTLRSQGLKVSLRILEECEPKDFSKVKNKWISELKSRNEAHAH